jgi:hypothetical protein
VERPQGLGSRATTRPPSTRPSSSAATVNGQTRFDACSSVCRRSASGLADSFASRPHPSRRPPPTGAGGGVVRRRRAVIINACDHGRAHRDDPAYRVALLVWHLGSGLSPHTTDARSARGEELDGERSRRASIFAPQQRCWNFRTQVHQSRVRGSGSTCFDEVTGEARERKA